MFLGFIDLVKAFDTVPRDKLWEILHERGISTKIVRLIQTIYKTNSNIVAVQDRTSNPFSTLAGLRQGGGLSPTLFNIYMDEIIKKCKEETNGVEIGYNNIKKQK